MSERHENMDEMDEFYRSAFDSAEMEVPVGFTDSVMQKLEHKGMSKVEKQCFSEKVGARKLFRFLQVSLVLNLLTVSVLGYYFWNNKKEAVQVGVPFQGKIKVSEKVKEVESPIVGEESEAQDASSSNDKSSNGNSEKNTSKPSSVNEMELKDKVAEEGAPVLEMEQAEVESADSSSVESQEVVFPEKEMNKVDDEPSSLDDLRERLKDTVNGVPLFK